MSGNGGGYEGKPDGTYYHFTPNYSCEGTEVAQQIVEFKDGQPYLYNNQNNKCSDGSSGVATDVVFSAFQKDFIIAQDYLFKRYDAKPSGIPDNLAEILCRDDFNNPSFEIVAHYDREKNQAVSRVYFSNAQISDFSVSRILSSQNVKYVSSQLTFTVDFSKITQPTRKFTGVIQQSSIANVKLGAVTCVVGGSLDVSNWSMKNFASLEVNGFNAQKNGDVYFFSDLSRVYYGNFYFISMAHLFKVSFDGILTDFSKAILGDDYKAVSRSSSNSDDLVIFSAQKNSEMWPSMFVFDTRNSRVKKITNLVPGAPTEAYSNANPVLTKDQYLFYDTQVLNSMMSADASIIRVYDLNTDSIQDVGQLNNASTGCRSYKVLPETNQALLFCQDSLGLNSVQIYDAKTKASKKLVLQQPPNCSISSDKVLFVNDRQTLFTEQTCADATSTLATSAVQLSLVDGSVSQVGGGLNRIAWVSENKKWLVLTNPKNESSVFDLDSNTIILTPINPRLGEYTGPGGTEESLTNFAMLESRLKLALINERYLYGLGGSADAPVMYQVDLSSGMSQPVCNQAIGKKLFLGAISDQKMYLFTYDQSLKVFRFYQVKGASDCERINEFPSEYPYVPKLITSDIGFGLLLGNPLLATSSAWTREAVFVPIDGRPPLKFNTDTTHNWDMDISASKNRIYLQGPGQNGLQQLFKFDLK